MEKDRVALRSQINELAATKAQIEAELTAERINRMKCAVSVAKYHFTNHKRSVRWFGLSEDGLRFEWAHSQAMKGAASVLVSEVKEVLYGPQSMALKSMRVPTDLGTLCLSLIWEKRSLDVCFQKQSDYELWKAGLKHICKNAKHQ